MNEEQLQELLSVYRHKQPAPDFVAQPRKAEVHWSWLAAAAVLVILIGIIFRPVRDDSWHADGRVLRAGETIAKPVRLESRAVGVVDVGARTIVRFVGGNRLALERGTIHATTISPPGIFVVDTPRARAVDMGCEYVLSVESNGGGMLRVEKGWVALNSWGQSMVPQGAKAIIAPDGRLSPPLFEDAPAAFQQAILRGDLATALPLARRRDALTLINLFRFATPDERLQIYDRLNQLVPAPASVPRDAMLHWTMKTLDPWWPLAMKASGVSEIKKKKRIP